MKSFQKVAALLVLALVASFAVQAQVKYPTKPIQVIVPAGPGGDTDLNCRIMAKYLEKELGQPVIIVNVNGAGGSLGSRKVKDSAPDGYTALFFHPSMFLNKLMGLVDYSFVDFENAGIAVMDNTNIFVVNATSPYKNLNDYISAAKAKPGKVRFATETGGFTHLQILAFQDATGADLNVVDVGSAAQKIVALLGKQVDAIGISYGIIKDYVASGKFRVIGVMSDVRNPMIPTIPTFKEQGVNMSFPKFFYYLFPKGTPQDIVGRFSDAIAKVAANPDAQAELNKFMVSAEYMTPAVANKYMLEQETTYFKYQNLMMNAKIEKEEVKK
ncbi:MAG TPA: tripartite tricarboxylate transporter substrate binding protein [Treponema sp.]|nr:tripartite tricarboxylate transporter substrate binding protein [Treponema sp.]